MLRDDELIVDNFAGGGGALPFDFAGEVVRGQSSAGGDRVYRLNQSFARILNLMRNTLRIFRIRRNIENLAEESEASLCLSEQDKQFAGASNVQLHGFGPAMAKSGFRCRDYLRLEQWRSLVVFPDHLLQASPRADCLYGSEQAQKVSVDLEFDVGSDMCALPAFIGKLGVDLHLRAVNDRRAGEASKNAGYERLIVVYGAPEPAILRTAEILEEVHQAVLTIASTEGRILPKFFPESMGPA